MTQSISQICVVFFS